MAQRKFTYGISGITDEKLLKEISQKILGISGVISCFSDVDNKKIIYEIDEWASDYDVMRNAMDILESYGGEMEFEKDDESQSNTYENEEISSNVSIEELTKLALSTQAEDDYQEVNEKSEKPEKKPMDEKKVRLIELAVATVIYIVGLILNKTLSSSLAGSYVCIVAFTIAGYEIIYEAIGKIIKKQFLSVQIIYTFASIIAVLLGKIIEISAVMILFSMGELLYLYLTDKYFSSQNKEETDENKTENTEIQVKTDFEKTVEKIQLYFIPSIIIVALLIAFIVPIFSSGYLNGLKVWGLRALMLVLISCPTAVVISSPFSYLFAEKNAEKQKIKVQNKNGFDKLNKVKTLIFNKNGVLTVGEFKIEKILAVKDFKGKLLSYFSAVLNKENSPLSSAFANYNLNENKMFATEIENYGLYSKKAKINGNSVILGTYKFLCDNDIKITENEENGLKIYLAVNGKFAGLVIFSETLNLNAEGAIKELYDLGVENTVILTSDEKENAKATRKALGINSSVSELNETAKINELTQICKDNKEKTVYIGNESSLLGIAGTSVLLDDYSNDNADFLISGNDMKLLPLTVKISKRLSLTLKENLIGSFVIKAIVAVLSLTGVFVNIYFTAGLEFLTVCLAFLNALRNK